MRTKTLPSKTPRTRPDRTCRSSGTPSSAWVSFKDAARLLGDDPYFWTEDSLHAVLRHYNVNFQRNAAKTILVHELCLLLGRLKEEVDKISTKHRSCILRLAKVGSRRPFVHLLVEVLRYHISFGNHKGDAEDYPYVVTLTQSEAEEDAASTIRMTQAIHEDYQRAYQFYDDGTIQDMEDEQAFARLLNEGPNPRVIYTQKAFDRWASRFVRSRKGTGYEEHQIEMDTAEDQIASSQSINQDILMSEASATTQDKSCEVEGQLHSCSNSVTSVTEESDLGDTNYIPDKESIPTLKRVSRILNANANETVKATLGYIDLDDETEDLAEAIDYDTDTDSVIARTTGQYGTIGRGRCPSCAKSHMVVKERHHAPTICK